jgi:4-alpha-glucanotransferase
MKLFDAIKNSLGDVNIIAEDLGMMTQGIIDLRDGIRFHRMKILEFAFGGGDEGDLPHNYPENCIAYTRTHDNDTVLGWYNKTGSKKEIEKAKKYLNLTYQ